ncbi:heavy metal sensor histidine kinase [Rhodanobacter sp. FW102-FHT14D06]|uniref:Sensor protein n=2 Tax=unclassified Rhodanobacter TaxID=2621553 RepID=A0AB74V037_9GAMM|nr:heavy metal sensor histidine kinase [Rhodanobacter denitrificans]UJJ58343.1 heavy metal sensor histidine kinase [Rhodanobacter denitrificans]
MDLHFRRHWSLSIAGRMTIWYTLSAFALILVATGVLYWGLVTSLAQEDARTLDDNLNNMRLLLAGSPASDVELIRRSQDAVWKTGRTPQFYFRILDGDAHTLVETPGMPAMLPAPTATELARFPLLATSDSRAVLSRSSDQFEVLSARLVGATPDAPARFIEVAMMRDNDEDLLARYRERLGLVLGLSLILCSLAGYVIARFGMRPIQRISRAAEHIRSATLHERIDTAGLPAELLGMAQTFNSMLDRLQEAFARVSQFSDDVAHELRTPINNLRGEIEVALSKARSDDEYRETLGSGLEECARISRVIQSLLFLARTENTVEPLPRESVDVGRALVAVQEFYEAAASEAGLALRVDAAPGSWAPLNRTLFQQAIGNLVSNAIAHTPRGGSVQMTTRVEADWLQVIVADTGSGIASEHLPHVFERFYRADTARSGAEQRVGLGLAVVKRIVERHNGRIEIESPPLRGTQVRIRLPRFG